MADADFRRADAYSFLDAANRENEEPLLDGEFFRNSKTLAHDPDETHTRRHSTHAKTSERSRPRSHGYVTRPLAAR